MVKVNPNRERSGLTLTAGELIALLQAYPSDLPVIATWESVWAGIRPDNFALVTERGTEALLIDVENYG